jgi:hypothetical protein
LSDPQVEVPNAEGTSTLHETKHVFILHYRYSHTLTTPYAAGDGRTIMSLDDSSIPYAHTFLQISLHLNQFHLVIGLHGDGLRDDRIQGKNSNYFMFY